MPLALPTRFPLRLGKLLSLGFAVTGLCLCLPQDLVATALDIVHGTGYGVAGLGVDNGDFSLFIVLGATEVEGR